MSTMHPIFEQCSMTTGSPARTDEQHTCPICEEEMTHQSTLTHTNGTCNHSFHLSCWEKWMLESPPATCPLDRERLRLRATVDPSATAQDLAIRSAHVNAINQETARAPRTATGPRVRLRSFLNEFYQDQACARGTPQYVTWGPQLQPTIAYEGGNIELKQSMSVEIGDTLVAAGVLIDYMRCLFGTNQSYYDAIFAPIYYEGNNLWERRVVHLLDPMHRAFVERVFREYAKANDAAR